jgi:hypothetical protein
LKSDDCEVVDEFESSSDSETEMEQGGDQIEIIEKNEVDSELANLQKVDIFLQQLPFFDKIKASGFRQFEEIRLNLSESLAFNEIRPGFLHWSNKLIVFMHEYGLYFTKDDHLKLIRIYLQVIQTPNIDLSTIEFCLNVLTELLKYFFFFCIKIWSYQFLSDLDDVSECLNYKNSAIIPYFIH